MLRHAAGLTWLPVQQQYQLDYGADRRADLVVGWQTYSGADARTISYAW
ncbi:MAG: hypothetical protein R3F59_36570 [Myxococcota bacterium]